MNRHARRAQGAVARKQSVPVTTMPRSGESVVLCEHKPALDAVTGYRVTPSMEFRRPDGTDGSSRWLLLCNDCRDRYGHDVQGCIERGKLRMGCDATWGQATGP